MPTASTDQLRLPARLDHSAYITAVRLETSGRTALTHLALVRDTRNVVRRAYVKQFPDNAPRGLFNEYFGYVFMSAMGIPQPEAAIMYAPSEDGAWHPSFVSFETQPQAQGTAKEIYTDLDDGTQLARLANRLLSCCGFYALVAADELCINEDRNTGNLIFTGARSFVVIDHSDILGGAGWTPETLAKYSGWCASKLLQICRLSDKLDTQQETKVLAATEVAVERFFEQHPVLSEALKGPGATLALDAIAARSASLADACRNHFGLLV